MSRSGSNKPDSDPPKKPQKPTIPHSSGNKPDAKSTSSHLSSDKRGKNSPGKPPRPPMPHSGSDKPDPKSPGKPPRPPSPYSRSPQKPEKPTSSHSGTNKSDPNSSQRAEIPISSHSGPDKSDPNSPQKTENPKTGSDKPGPNLPRKREKPKTSHGGRYKYYNTGSPVSPFQPVPSSCSSSSGSVSGQTRPDSVSSSSSTSAPLILPYGNIVPSGRVKPVILDYKSTRSTVLGSGTGNYGYGSVVRGSARKTGASAAHREALAVPDPEELKKMGNERYKKMDFSGAVGFYNRAIRISPNNAVYRFNKGMAFMGLKRFEEAVREFEGAIRLNKDYIKARYNLASIFIRLGQVENARSHLFFPGYKSDPKEVRKCQAVETHLNKCTEARLIKDWKSVLKEADAAIAAGADSSPQLNACRAEVLLKLYSLEETNKILPKVPESSSSSEWKFFGILSVAYLFYVRAQIEMALGSFEEAASLAEKAGKIDPKNAEVALYIHNVKQATRARTRGNFYYSTGRYEEARAAYSEGIAIEPTNTILLYNRAACQFQLQLWESSADDCTRALLMQPNYTKALLRRAASNYKLERWARAVSDYEILRRERPHDVGVEESLFHAQIALKKSKGEDVSYLKFGRNVELVSALEPFKAFISIPGVCVVFFTSANDPKCKQISKFLDKLCKRYRMMIFLKVDVEQSREIAAAENVKNVPTFKIYRKGERIKEMISPSPEVLETSMSYFSF